MDLFEYNVEESIEEYVKPQGKKVNIATESPESKIRKLESETTTTSGSKSAEKDEEDEEEENVSPGKRVKVIQTKKEIREIQMKNGQELKEETGSTSMSIFERLEARAKEEKETKQQEEKVPEKTAQNKTAIDERESIITKTVQRMLGIGGKDSVKKKVIQPTKPVKELVQETVENYNETEKEEVQENPQMGDKEECFFKKVAVEDLYVPNPDAVFIWSEDSNQKTIKKEEDESPAKEEEEIARQEEIKEEVFAEIMEILYDKEPKEEASEVAAPREEGESFQGPTEEFVQPKEEENIDTNMLNNIMGPEENYDDLDEADLMAKMKELEEDDMTDKWALMDQFQKFQNLSDLEGGSIQDKLREIKELLIMLGVPW